MKKRLIVLSLGGSLIIPGDIDIRFLKRFKKLILEKTKKFKFIIVCGGGKIARIYINALRKAGVNERLQSLSGISITRANARFMNYFFNKDPKEGVPHTIESVENYIRKQDIVFCGGLRYKPNQTSDATASQIADHFRTFFINMTNVDGLYDRNPKKYRNAKLIPKISWEDFFIMANKIKFSPGQHFILDIAASKNILRNKTKTYIIGKDLKQLKNILENRKFGGTIIHDGRGCNN